MRSLARRCVAALALAAATVSTGAGAVASASEPDFNLSPEYSYIKPTHRAPTPLDFTPYRDEPIAWIDSPAGSGIAFQRTPKGDWVELIVLDRSGHYHERPYITVYPVWDDPESVLQLVPAEFREQLGTVLSS